MPTPNFRNPPPRISAQQLTTREMLLRGEHFYFRREMGPCMYLITMVRTFIEPIYSRIKLFRSKSHWEFFFFSFVFPKEPSEVLRNAENSSSCLKRAYCPMQADSLTSILAQALLAGLRKFDLPSAFNKCPHLPFYPPLDSNKLQ